MPFNLNSSGLSAIAAGPPQVTQRREYPTAQSFLSTFESLSRIDANKQAGARADRTLDLQADRDKASAEAARIEAARRQKVFEQGVIENQEDQKQREVDNDLSKTTEERLKDSQTETKRANAAREADAKAAAELSAKKHKLNTDKFAHKKAQDKIISDQNELKLKGEVLVGNIARKVPLDLSPEDRAMYILTEMVANPNSKYVANETLFKLFDTSHNDINDMTPEESIEHSYRQGVYGMVNLANNNTEVAREYIAKSNNVNPEDILNIEYEQGDDPSGMKDVATFYIKGNDQPSKLSMEQYVSKVPGYQGMMNQALANIKGAKQIELENVRIENKEALKVWTEDQKAARDAAKWSSTPVKDSERSAASLILENTLGFFDDYSEEEKYTLAEETVQHAKYISGTQRVSYPDAMKKAVSDMITNATVKDSYFFGLLGGETEAGEVNPSKPNTPQIHLKRQESSNRQSILPTPKPGQIIDGYEYIGPADSGFNDPANYRKIN